ncbi:hypothetical protein AAY72_03205 [Alishewanella sp. WH16-1]|uniref:hypothetical protein n=1 Tax=Alishewanella sp. WH16-1 TaxID=1651088 RepID=UPI00070F5052|nr:hypothetical protein [Alishewanella sp. WH16-1]KRS22457.1 hypothetical protein AAY72_03205 [Alishewanella sp. WH16-1]
MDISLLSRSYATIPVYQSEAFDTEFDLVNKFEDLMTVFLSNQYTLEREFDCGYGIADAVLFKHRLGESVVDLSQISPDWAYTLKTLPYRKSFDINFIRTISGVSLSSAKKALDEFVNAGFCVRKPDAQFVKIKQPRTLTSNIVAFEAKLRDWKKALIQASRYKTFANESWVLLDRSQANAAISNLAEFEKFNIGLATFSTDGTYDVYHEPTTETARSSIAFWKANTLLAKRLILKD